jgi:hypothetical protein
LLSDEDRQLMVVATFEGWRDRFGVRNKLQYATPSCISTFNYHLHMDKLIKTNSKKQNCTQSGIPVVLTPYYFQFSVCSAALKGTKSHSWISNRHDSTSLSETVPALKGTYE